MLVKNPFFLGFTAIVFIALQVGVSYLSFDSFLKGDLLLGFFFLLFVPLLPFLMGLYYIWYRRQRAVRSASRLGASAKTPDGNSDRNNFRSLQQ